MYPKKMKNKEQNCPKNTHTRIWHPPDSANGQNIAEKPKKSL
jgi:hypothetical protein